MRERRERLREQQQQNDGIQPVEGNTDNSLFQNLKFICYSKMSIVDNFHVQFKCSNLSLNYHSLMSKINGFYCTINLLLDMVWAKKLVFYVIDFDAYRSNVQYGEEGKFSKFLISTCLRNYRKFL